uniref:Uncharacterized protein n=1 Tax=Rhizophora mucronata TaxID=61149 RepID=A0A2P2J3J4_RHIMU
MMVKTCILKIFGWQQRKKKPAQLDYCVNCMYQLMKMCAP